MLDLHHTQEPEVARDESGPELNPTRRFDVDEVRRDFPILQTQARGKTLVYLDNGATAQKPQVVIDRINQYYSGENANIHRGVHYLAELATRAYEQARLTAKSFLNAAHDHEIIFTRGTTEAINLVAFSYGQLAIESGDEIIVSALEHHANIVPWQLLCERSGAVLKVVPISDSGEFLFDEYSNLLNDRTKLVAVSHISNALGTVLPVKEIIQLAHERDVPVLLDGAQSAPHMPIDVQDLDCDFFVFSGHKVFGPTGIGVLYGKEKWLNAMPPYQSGGDMIEEVSWEKTTFNTLPFKFEAGTPNIAGAIGLAAALEYLKQFDASEIARHEHDLLQYATQRASEIEGLKLIGTARDKASILSFVHNSAHHADIGAALDQQGIAIRTGHHCTQPLMKRLGITGTARASFAFYNTRDEVDAFIAALQKAIRLFG